MNEVPADRVPGETRSHRHSRSTASGDPPPSETDLLRAELEALRRQNVVLRETLDTIEGSVVVFDPERRYLLANRAYHAIYPHLPADDELVGRKYEELLALSIAAGAVDNPAAVTDTEAFIAQRVGDMERRMSTPREAQNARPGRESFHVKTGRWYLVRSRRTAGGNDVTLRVDITAQKLMHEQLLQAREAAENASQMKSQFLGNVTHELRTPLNAVINFARLIVDQIHGPLRAPQYRDYARDIADSGMHLLGLIDELLDLARAEAGRLTIAEGIADPGGVIVTACRVMTPEAISAGIALSHDIPHELGHMRGDQTRLRQVLLNLISNAIKFTQRGGTIRVCATRESDGDLRIVVDDSGIGIPAVDLARVMEPFEQVDEVSSKLRPGVGLGLPLARHLVELHGGSLTLASAEGAGTSAVVRLPASRMTTGVAR